MKGTFAEYRAFWREFRRTFHTTGAIAPSGPSLCRALATQVCQSPGAKRILEIGPGTGAVTSEIICRMGPDDQLDLVEINTNFAGMLRKRLSDDESWAAVAPRTRVLEMPVEKLPPDDLHRYSCMISGLPLNNFSSDCVQQILEHLQLLATDGCTLSFFEYVGIRRLKALISSAQERERLTEIGRILQATFANWEFRRQCVIVNVPPAWVHHLRFAAPVVAGEPYPLVQPFTC